MIPSDHRSPDAENKPLTDDEMDYLLSASGLGGSQRDNIFERSPRPYTAKRLVRQRRGHWKPRIAIGAALLASAAASLFLWGRGSGRARAFPKQGGVDHEVVSIDATCLRASLQRVLGVAPRSPQEGRPRKCSVTRCCST